MIYLCILSFSTFFLFVDQSGNKLYIFMNGNKMGLLKDEYL